MARTPKQLVKRIQQAQSRVESATGKRMLIKKAGAKPVMFKPLSKAGATRQRKEYLSLRDIMRETTARTRQLMREGQIEVTYMKKTKSGRAILCETVTHKPNGETTKYKQLVSNLDAYTAKFTESTWIQIDCSCPRYMYMHDYALHEKNASNLRYAIDEPPDIMNPGPNRQLGVCKHGYRVLQTVVGRGW